jgi:hypothetical protein
MDRLNIEHPNVFRPVFLFRTEKNGSGRPENAAGTDAVELSSDGGPAIRCRACGMKITSVDQKITVNGGHRHTFANPHGIVYEIGCFQSANGCAQAGPTSGEFTWFNGYRWRISVCCGCVTHLGWFFASPGGAAFYGLIVSRLVEET